MAVDHYENFPVASLLLPARLRPAVRAVYAFARAADDIADEGEASTPVRMSHLDAWRLALHDLAAQRPTGRHLSLRDQAIFTQLGQAMQQHALPLQPFLDLLTAFTRDLQVQRYPDEAALLDYCRHSADPVGRIMLHLYGAGSPLDLQQSDAICTGLQRANFCQDVVIDWDKGRLYLPLDALQRHGIDEAWLDQFMARRPAVMPPAWRALMDEQCQRAAALLRAGAPLAWRLRGRIGLELRLVVLGGLRILEKIRACDHDLFTRRPVIGPADFPGMAWRALCRPCPSPANRTFSDVLR